jgi:T5SS/PEP-CTERM-associated repeat protein/autotransporter-associated beta strand protein
LITSTAGVNVAVSDGVVIKGGAGGSDGYGTTGAPGGVGISGANLSLTLGAGATVTGGLAGDGTTRASAIVFTGTGANALELVGNGGTSGQTYATITGNVIGATGAGASNTLKLTGAGGVFDLTTIDAGNGNGTQFQNFANASVNTTGTWIVTGTQAGSVGINWAVNGGTLQLGSATATATIAAGLFSGINNGGTLATGAMGATVLGTIGAASGGTVAVGALSSGSALTISGGSLYFNTGSTLSVTLGAPTTTAVVSVAYNLTYKGALTIADGGQMAEGTYTLASYGGNIGSGSGFTSVSGPSSFDYTVAQDTTNKVVLLTVVSAGLYWNGTTISGAGPLDGGTGTWTAAAGGVPNWTNSGGTTHVVTDPAKKAIFAGTAGTVTVDAGQGSVGAKGLKFVTSGYTITGDALTLATTSGAPQIEVVGATTLATIGSPLAGTQGLQKIGAGTLVLSGTNTYSGGTTVTAGTLRIGGGGTSGSVVGDIANNAALVFDRSDASSYAGAISGTGTVEKTGAGTLTLTGSHTYSGNTTVSGGTLAFAGGTSSVTSAIVSIGNATGTDGTLSVTGASTNVSLTGGSMAQTRVGDGGNGTLVVADGATLSNGDTSIGYNAGSTGSVTVDGAGSTWGVTGGTTYVPSMLKVADNGTGTLVISNGGTVTSPGGEIAKNSGSVGTVTVTGSGSSWTIGNGTIYAGSLNVGEDGNGSLTVSAGATVSADFLGISSGSTSQSSLTITGAGSHLSSKGEADIGYYGAATLTVADGGKFTEGGDAYVGYYGGSYLPSGSTAKVTSTVVVTGTGSTWDQSAGDLYLGTYVAGTVGTLLVEKGGTVTSKGGYLGYRSGAEGVATVTGTGSSWNVGVDGLLVGAGAAGTLTVSAGATVTSAYSVIGSNAGSTGEATVTGAGSSWQHTDLYVGRDGTGTLTVADGASVVSDNAEIGYSTGSQGTVTVTGPNSSWTLRPGPTSVLVVGDGGSGTLVVEKGGAVNVPDLEIGSYSPGNGSLTVTGTGSTFTVGTNGLIVGNSATGVLTVADGAVMTGASDAYVGSGSGSTGTATVTDSGSKWDLGGKSLTLGYSGTGSLTVANGALVTNTGTVYVGYNTNSSGTVTVTGADSLLDAGTNQVVLASDSGVTGTLTVANGGTAAASLFAKGQASATASLTLDSGTLRATAAQADFLMGFGAGEVTLAGGGGTIDTAGFDVGVTAALSGSGDLTKAGAGTLTLTGASTFSGTAVVAGGTLQISGGGSLTSGAEAKAGTVLTGDPTGASTGTVAGGVMIDDGATLRLLSGATTLTFGGLSLGSAATVAVTLRAPSTTAALVAGTNPSLAGTLDLTAGTGFNSGTYRLIDYTGTLSGTGLTLGTTPAHSLFAIDTATANQVNLIVAASQWWNGAGGAGLNGGSGAWDASGATTNWTDAGGAAASAWSQGSLATFGGTAGTVTVNAATAPQVAGLEFVTSGYTVTGGPITLVGFHNDPVTRVSVDDGTAGGGVATVASALTGGQALEKTGPGTLVLSGTNTYTGATTVAAGTLRLDGGSLAGDVAVKAGAALSGDPAGTNTGTVAGHVAVDAGGSLQLVTGTTTLNVGGGLTLDPASALSVLVLAPSTTAAVKVGGNLTLAGTLDLTAGAGFGSGTYRLVDYAGTLSGTGLTLGTTPAHSLFAVDTATANQVNLIVAAGLWWNGAVTTAGGSAVAGGTGTWNVAATTNWTDTPGSAANAWSQGSLAIFGGAAGTVTVNTATAPQAAGLEFVTSGYTVTGGPITLVGFHNDPVTRVSVDDGTAGGGSATIASVLAGGQTLEKTGAGTLILTGANTYSGGTTVTAGTLQIGAGGTTGSVVGAIANGGTLVFDRADDLAAGGAITGAGALVKRGAGRLTLSGSNSAGAGTTVAGGTLVLADGSQLASAVTVQAGASLAAQNAGTTPTVAGVVTVQTGGTLQVAPATGGDGLSTTGLVLASGSHLAVTLGAQTNHAAVSTGSLALDGILDVTDAGGMMQGVYRLIDYTTLTSDHGLQLGTTPANFTYQVQRQPGQVNLAVSAIGTGILYWNGSQTTANGTIQGGTGTWSSDPAHTNWTDAAASGSRPYQSTFAVFGGSAGTVTVDGAKGPLAVAGMQFLTDGYALSGDAITLNDPSGLTQVRVGDGTAAGAGVTAQIASALTGQGGLVKTDLGTLVLSGANTYAGDTQVKGGTLSLAGSVDGDIYVYDQATLSGGGRVGKTVHVLDGGTLAGSAGNGLTMAGLDLAGKANLAVALGAPGGAGVFQVNGNVTLGGTLAVTPAAGFGLGVYRIINYTGTLTNNGMQVGAMPAGFLGGLQTSVANQVNLFVDDPNSPVAFWNGGTTVPTQTVAGGSGTWTANPTNWTNASGTINRRWPSGFAIFQGTPGTVTVDNSAGAVTATGMQFVESGYRIQGEAITLAGNAPAPIRVGDGTTAGAGTVATIASALTGSGGLEKSDLGTLILTAANTYTGGTKVTGGTLQIGDGGTSGWVEGAIVDDARLVYARSDTYAFRGQVSGAGQVEFQGGTVLYGDGGKFTGSVTARNAFVRLDPGAVTSAPFTLESGSVLGGTATIGGLTANAGSTVAPGYSPGTISVNGAVAFNAGSVYAVDVTPSGQHDLITATGPVTLSSQAQVTVHATPGRYAARSTYAILTTTATVTGRFGGVTSDYAFLKPSLSYDAQNVYLGLTSNERRFTDFARTRNQFALAAAAQELGMGNRVFDTLMTLGEGQVSRAFQRLEGEGHASLNTVIQQQSVYLRDAVGARLQQSESGDDALTAAARATGPKVQSVEGDPSRALWAQAYGGFGRRTGTGNAGAIANSAGGMLAGLDVGVGDAVRVGVLGGLGRSHVDVPTRDMTGSFANYDVGLYGSARLGAVSLRGGLSQSWHEVSATRAVVYPGMSASDSVHGLARDVQAFGEVATEVGLGSVQLQPFASLAYVGIDARKVNERGSGGTALSGTVRGQDVTYTTLGTRAATTVTWGDAVLTPSVRLGWQHAFGDLSPQARFAFAGGRPFDVIGVPVVQDMAVLGTGLAYNLSERAKIQVNYTGQLAPRATQNTFTAEYALEF